MGRTLLFHCQGKEVLARLQLSKKCIFKMFKKSTEKHKKWLNDGITGDFLFSISPILYMAATFFYNEKNF